MAFLQYDQDTIYTLDFSIQHETHTMSDYMPPWLYEQPTLSGFIKLLVSGRHTDVNILCRGHTFKVHKTVLSAASTFFDRVCDSQFQEGQTSTITLDDDEPALMARMIIFAYTSTYYTDSLNSARPEVSSSLQYAQCQYLWT